MISLDKLKIGQKVVFETRVRENWVHSYIFKQKGYFVYLNGLVTKIIDIDDRVVSIEILDNKKIPAKYRDGHSWNLDFPIGKKDSYSSFPKKQRAHGYLMSEEEANLEDQKFYHPSNWFFPFRKLHIENPTYGYLLEKMENK